MGDDWQAINGFAGATTIYFDQFATRLAGSVTRTLATNYRSGRDIVELGNAVMDNCGTPAWAESGDSGLIEFGDLLSFESSGTEKVEGGAELLHAVRRLAADALDSGDTVAVLSRTRSPVPERMLDEYDANWEKALSSGLTGEHSSRLEVSTVHSFKGREADTVIIVDASDASFPFIHPHWSLFRVFGDSIESLVFDERRLLYVAVTRAAKRLILLKNGGEFSELLNADEADFQLLNWTGYKPVTVYDPSKCVITVGSVTDGTANEGTFPIKDSPKAAGFRYIKKPKPHWARSMQLGSSRLKVLVEHLKLQSWSLEARAVVVTLQFAEGEQQVRYLVSDGQWTPF